MIKIKSYILLDSDDIPKPSEYLEENNHVSVNPDSNDITTRITITKKGTLILMISMRITTTKKTTMLVIYLFRNPDRMLLIIYVITTNYGENYQDSVDSNNIVSDYGENIKNKVDSTLRQISGYSQKTKAASKEYEGVYLLIN